MHVWSHQKVSVARPHKCKEKTYSYKTKNFKMWDMKKSRILRKEKSVGSAVSPPWTWNNGWSVTGHDDQQNYGSLVIACFWVNVIGQRQIKFIDQRKDLTGTVPILARDCTLTSSYFMPCRPLPSWGPWVNKIPRDGDYCFYLCYQ